MKKKVLFSVMSCLALAVGSLPASAKLVPRPPVRPFPQPVINVGSLRQDEKPVTVETTEAVVAENAFFKRVKTSFVFTNPNSRAMSGELEFPIPDGAIVCGYALEINGSMIPGVVCEKEKARVSFENETRKGVDPGIVEQVKGNIWRTRIFPLNPKTPRKAEVEYIAAKDSAAVKAIAERDGDDIFIAMPADDGAAKAATIGEKIAAFTKGVILWDASMSAKPFAAAWRNKLEELPAKGEWSLVVFRHEAETRSLITDKAALLAAIDELVYDGGTDIGAAIKTLGCEPSAPVLLFTDEIDTLGLDAPRYEDLAGLTIASRDDKPARAVEVRKAAKGEKLPEGVQVGDGKILATVWAARRMSDLASQADARKDEFLELGRKYGVAGPGLSLIVLETLSQYLEHKIEPHRSMSFYNEWKKRRAADDDPIAAKRAKTEHEQKLLRYWEERVKWWKNPKPPKRTPKSGLFDDASAAVEGSAPVMRSMLGSRTPRSTEERRANYSMEMESVAAEAPRSEMRRSVSARTRGGPLYGDSAKRKAGASSAAPESAAPRISLKAWDPKTPYLEALKAAGKDGAYKAYLKERDTHGASPAFYLDCAGWFFKEGDRKTAARVITNLAEFKLEDAALWRSMGWRAREAGAYEIAVLAFRKVLAMRGEEAQSRRDLAIVLMEDGKTLFKAGYGNAASPLIAEAMKYFADAAFETRQRRSGFRGNDFQVSVIALEELNGLISWTDAVKWPEGRKPVPPAFDPVYRRDLPVKLRIVMSWDADQTDIDLHVLEPNGEEAYYGHRRTAEGGFVSEDVTTGYGPEEYLKKDLESGVYKILTNYFASRQASLTGAATITATVYTDWGTGNEKREIITFRLDKPKNKLLIGEVKL